MSQPSNRIRLNWYVFADGNPIGRVDASGDEATKAGSVPAQRMITPRLKLLGIAAVFRCLRDRLASCSSERVNTGSLPLQVLSPATNASH